MAKPSNSRAIRAFANPVRRSIVELLRAGEASVNALVAQFDIARPAISRHLRVLREAGLVTYRAEHNVRYYALNEPEMDRLRDSFDDEFGDFWRPQGAVSSQGDIDGVERGHRLFHEVRVSTCLPISSDLAFRYCTDEELFREWVGPDATNSGTPGGTFRATSAFGGQLIAEYLAMEPGRIIVIRVIQPLMPDDNLYTISFTPEGDGTRVELRHYVANEVVAQLLLTAWYETWGQLRKLVLAKY
jgi:DNA-binding transcriptional ArsR family regulator/uncharacterized protein YndB with AHSA1/START domain